MDGRMLRRADLPGTPARSFARFSLPAVPTCPPPTARVRIQNARTALVHSFIPRAVCSVVMSYGRTLGHAQWLGVDMTTWWVVVSCGRPGELQGEILYLSLCPAMHTTKGPFVRCEVSKQVSMSPSLHVIVRPGPVRGLSCRRSAAHATHYSERTKRLRDRGCSASRGPGHARPLATVSLDRAARKARSRLVARVPDRPSPPRDPRGDRPSCRAAGPRSTGDGAALGRRRRSVAFDDAARRASFPRRAQLAGRCWSPSRADPLRPPRRWARDWVAGLIRRRSRAETAAEPLRHRARARALQDSMSRMNVPRRVVCPVAAEFQVPCASVPEPSQRAVKLLQLTRRTRRSCGRSRLAHARGCTFAALQGSGCAQAPRAPWLEPGPSGTSLPHVYLLIIVRPGDMFCKWRRSR